MLLSVLLGREPPVSVHDDGYGARDLARLKDPNEEPLVPPHYKVRII